MTDKQIMEGYRIGENERIALANANSDLRSQLLQANQLISKLADGLERVQRVLEALHVSEPAEWDGVSYCVSQCGAPATHRRLLGFSGDTPVEELVCCLCVSAI
jgi:hypothetical protein